MLQRNKSENEEKGGIWSSEAEKPAQRLTEKEPEDEFCHRPRKQRVPAEQEAISKTRGFQRTEKEGRVL